MSTTFLFGKLPAHGDFVSRGLCAEERDSLDGWLCAEMAAARTDTGRGFEAAFDAAPPWRFAWREEQACVAGALAASADKAGRRFPVILGLRAVAAEQAAAAAEYCEGALAQAISQAWSADRVLDDAAACEIAAGPLLDFEGWWVDGGDEAGIEAIPGRRPPRLICAMLGAGRAAA